MSPADPRPTPAIAGDSTELWLVRQAVSQRVVAHHNGILDAVLARCVENGPRRARPRDSDVRSKVLGKYRRTMQMRTSRVAGEPRGHSDAGAVRQRPDGQLVQQRGRRMAGNRSDRERCGDGVDGHPAPVALRSVFGQQLGRDVHPACDTGEPAVLDGIEQRRSVPPVGSG
jgi:hypothetical protein